MFINGMTRKARTGFQTEETGWHSALSQSSLEKRSPTFLAPGTGFVEDGGTRAELR